MSNQDSLHVLYASQAALKYAVPKPKCKQASLRNSTRSLEERRVEPLGNLKKGFTVRNTRGLPFNASYACTVMHEGSDHSFQSLLSYQSTPQSRIPPGGGPSWAYLPYLPLESKAREGKNETQAKHAFMHACVCSHQGYKKGGWCVRTVVMVSPALHRRTGPLVPHDNQVKHTGLVCIVRSMHIACLVLP